MGGVVLLAISPGSIPAYISAHSDSSFALSFNQIVLFANCMYLYTH